MGHFCCTDKELIHKARLSKRPQWRKTRSPARLESLHQAMARAVKTDLITGINTFRKKIKPDLVYDAWMDKDYDKLFKFIPFDELGDEFEESKSRLMSGMERASKIGLDVLSPNEIKSLRYDYGNPKIQRILDNRVADWNTKIGQESVENIRDIVRRQFTEALTPRRMATEIRNQVGLNPRLASAQLNFVKGLYQQGLSEDRITQLAEANYQRLLDYRSEMIARTEAQYMINHGQLSVWQEAQNQGMITRESKKVWVVDGDPCELCQSMDGTEVDLQEMWITPNGPVMVPSEIHPNCLCLMTLNMGE